MFWQLKDIVLGFRMQENSSLRLEIISIFSKTPLGSRALMKSLFNHTMQQSIQTVNIDPYAPPPSPWVFDYVSFISHERPSQGQGIFPCKGCGILARRIKLSILFFVQLNTSACLTMGDGLGGYTSVNSSTTIPPLPLELAPGHLHCLKIYWQMPHSGDKQAGSCGQWCIMLNHACVFLCLYTYNSSLSCINFHLHVDICLLSST